MELHSLNLNTVIYHERLKPQIVLNPVYKIEGDRTKSIRATTFYVVYRASVNLR